MVASELIAALTAQRIDADVLVDLDGVLAGTLRTAESG
jgi:hypothetical protein